MREGVNERVESLSRTVGPSPVKPANLCRGAYSYVRPGGKDAHARLAAPLESTLFFAGEATDADFPATVAGAVQSGQRAARELLAA